MANVSEKVAGAPEDESPSGSVIPTRRAFAYTRSVPGTARSQSVVKTVMS